MNMHAYTYIYIHACLHLFMCVTNMLTYGGSRVSKRRRDCHHQAGYNLVCVATDVSFLATKYVSIVCFSCLRRPRSLVSNINQAVGCWATIGPFHGHTSSITENLT